MNEIVSASDPSCDRLSSAMSSLSVVDASKTAELRAREFLDSVVTRCGDEGLESLKRAREVMKDPQTIATMRSLLTECVEKRFTSKEDECGESIRLVRVETSGEKTNYRFDVAYTDFDDGSLVYIYADHDWAARYVAKGRYQAGLFVTIEVESEIS